MIEISKLSNSLRPTLNEKEKQIKDKINEILIQITPNRFKCDVRKGSGQSVICKPVDLAVYHLIDGNLGSTAICIEVADVNTTQMVSEAIRLYYDTCPIKILIFMRGNNAPASAVDDAIKLLCLQYGQLKIESTPARVHYHDDHDGLRKSLKELLQLGH